MEEHGPALVLFSRQWCSTPEDIVQESFLKLIKQEPFPTHPIAWLYRVIRNGSINAARSQRRRKTYETAAAEAKPAWFAHTLDARLDAALAQQSLETLEIELREVIVARIWGGLSYEEIAATTGTSVSTAYRRYLQGIEALRTAMKVAPPASKSKPSSLSQR